MRLIGKRPMCTLCLCVILSGMLGVWMPGEVFWWLLGAAAVGSAAVAAAVRLRRMAFYTGCMAVCLLFTLPLGFGASSRYYDGIVHRLEADAGQTCVVEGIIVERKWSVSYNSGFLLRADTVDGEDMRVTFLLECAFPADCQPGDRVRIAGTSAAHELDVNGFSQRRYYLSRGVALRLMTDQPEQITVLAEDVFDLSVSAARLNTALAARLRLLVGDETGRLLSALFLGRRADLDDGVIQNFKRLGLSHLLALSGLHLSLLTGAVGWVLSRLRLPRGWRTVLQLAFVAAYVLLTGMPISVLRAALMLALTCLASALFAEADSMTSLFGAATLICVFNPSALLDLGLWMSVFATLGMLLCRNLTFAGLPRWLRGAARTAAATFAANLMTLPFVALSDGELSLISIFTNLVFVPLMSLLLYCAPVILLSQSLFSAPISALAGWVMAAVQRIARAEGITIALQNAGVFWFLLPLLAVCAVLLLHPPKRKRWGALALVCSAALFLCGALWVNTPRTLEVVYTHVGQSEAIVLRQPEGTVICDMGDGSYTPLRAAATYAADLGAAEINTLMLTHYHTRHISTVLRFTENMTLRRLLLPTPNTDREREIVTDIEEIAALAGVEVSFYPDGLPIRIGEMTITPHTRTLIPRSQQPILLLRIERGGEVLTYVGSAIGESALAETAVAYAADSGYLIFGDHGPNHRSCMVWDDLPNARQIILASAETLTYMLPADADIPVVAATRIRLMQN